MKTKLFVIAIMVVILVTCLCLPVFAYADTSTNDIVNFNQIFKNENSESNSYGGITRVSTDYTYRIYGTATVSDYIYSRVNDLDNSHRYYFNSYNNSVDFRVTSYSSSIQSPFIFSGLNYFQYAINFYAGNTYDVTIKPILIDLTQMFGAATASSMTVEDCQEIFVADYYAYNTGTPIYLDSINAYAKGVSDTLSSFNITYNNYAIGSGSFAYSNTSIEKGVFAYGETENMYYWSGVLGIYLGGTIYKGTNFVVDFYLNCPDTSGESDSYKLSKTLQFGYVDSNNNLVEVVSITPTFSGTYFTYTGSFILPVDSDTIYCWVDYSTTSNSYDPSYWFAVTTSLEFQSFNVDSLLKAQKDSIFELYNEYYGINGEGYAAIYDLGYTAGLNDTNPYTFGYLMSSVIEAPLNAVLSIFNFDFLGVNFKNVITLILTLCIIIAIVRLFLGGKE